MTTPVTAGIAELVGRDELDVALQLGGGWRTAEIEYDPRVTLGLAADDVYVLGEPLQLVALRLYDGLRWSVGAAGIEWAGHTPILTITQGVLFGPGDDLEVKAAEVRRLLLARRRSFRYCEICACPTAPEYRENDNVCHGCSSEWLNVVY